MPFVDQNGKILFDEDNCKVLQTPLACIEECLDTCCSDSPTPTQMEATLPNIFTDGCGGCTSIATTFILDEVPGFPFGLLWRFEQADYFCNPFFDPGGCGLPCTTLAADLMDLRVEFQLQCIDALPPTPNFCRATLRFEWGLDLFTFPQACQTWQWPVIDFSGLWDCSSFVWNFTGAPTIVSGQPVICSPCVVGAGTATVQAP